MQADPIDQYLDLLGRRLPKDDEMAAGLLREAERDLRAAAARFANGGWTSEEAAAQAIAQYPSHDALLRRFALDAAFSVSISRPFKLAASLIVGLAGLLSLAGLIFAMGNGEGAVASRAAGAVLSLGVLAHGLVTLRLFWSKRRGLMRERGLVFLGGLALAVIGGFAALWTIYLGSSSGRWEGFALLQVSMIGLQGGLCAWIALPRLWSPWLE